MIAAVGQRRRAVWRSLLPHIREELRSKTLLFVYLYFVYLCLYLYLCICIFVFAHLGSLEVAAASHKTAHQTTASDKSVFVYLYFAICVFVYLYLHICAVRVLYKGGSANKTVLDYGI